MPENNDIQTTFDHWLAQSLKSDCPADPGFTQRVVREMQRLDAEKMLRRVVLQERLAKGLVIVAVLTGIGLVCCPPVLNGVYCQILAILKVLIRFSMEPNLNSFAAILIPFLLLFGIAIKSLWKNLAAN